SFAQLWLSSGDAPDILSKVTTGLGAATTVTYKHLSEPSVHQMGSGAVYPTINIAGSKLVVSHLDTSNGIGGVQSLDYTYADARGDLNGRGFLGVAQKTSHDLQTDIWLTTSYHQDFPFIGLIDTQTTRLGSNSLNSKTNTYLANIITGCPRAFPFLS